MLKIGVLLGDDIGLEVVPECVKVIKAAAARTPRSTVSRLRWRKPGANVVVPVVGVKSVFGWAVPATVVKPTVICEVRSPVRVTVKSMSTVPLGCGSMAVVPAMDRGVVAGARRSSSSSRFGRVMRLGFRARDRKSCRAGRSVAGMLRSLVGEADLT